MRESSTRLHDDVTLFVSFPRTERFKRSIAFAGPFHWNELPGHLKSINDRSLFISKLKFYIWNAFLNSVVKSMKRRVRNY